MNEDLNVSMPFFANYVFSHTAIQTHETFERFLRAQSEDDPSAAQILDPLQLRYFSPTELLRLFGFQRKEGEDHFKWPVEMSSKSKYRLIGNSVNVDVVAHLIRFLLQQPGSST